MILILLGKKSMKTILEDESRKWNVVKGEGSKKDKIFSLTLTGQDFKIWPPVQYFLFIFFQL